MLPTEPLPLHHSWPLFESGVRVAQGVLATGHTPTAPDGGTFSCDLRDDSLRWGKRLFTLYGVRTPTIPHRELLLPLFEEGSRAALERLRAYAIRHRRGFTIDTQMLPIGSGTRWLRIVAMPRVVDGRTVAIEGMQHDITHEYR